ncbi:Transmembrane protein 50B [Trebouxia sp. C0010 RCD-2024]
MALERRRGCMDWLLRADIDWEGLSSKPKEYSPGIAGALFGAGWWCWLDVFVHSAAVDHNHVPITYHIPGCVATFALVIMNITSRTELAESDDYNTDDNFAGRSKLLLFISYLTAFGAVAGSVAVLISCVQQQSLVEVGVGSVVQCGLVLLSGLLLWAFRTESSGYGY